MAVSLDHLILPLDAGQKISSPIPSMFMKLKSKLKIGAGIIYIPMVKHIGLDSPLKRAGRNWGKNHSPIPISTGFSSSAATANQGGYSCAKENRTCW